MHSAVAQLLHKIGRKRWREQPVTAGCGVVQKASVLGDDTIEDVDVAEDIEQLLQDAARHEQEPPSRGCYLT